jgi:hypothetical protein
MIVSVQNGFFAVVETELFASILLEALHFSLKIRVC